MNGSDRDLAHILETPSQPEGCPTRWTLQRYALDELMGDERETMAIHIASCEHCRAHVAELDGYHDDFLSKRPFASVEAEVSERAMFLPDDPEIEVERSSRPRFSLAVVSALAGATVLALTLMFVPLDRFVPEPAHDGLKGVTDLQAAVLRDGSVVRVTDSTRLHPGDEIQFRVDTGSYDHVMVLGMDGTGDVAVYQPFGGGESIAVRRGAGRTLDTAFQLDDAPGPEVYVAFFTHEPVSSSDASDLLRAWAGENGARGLAVQAPQAALGGAVEVMLVDKEVP